MGFPVNKANPKLDESTPIRILERSEHVRGRCHGRSTNKRYPSSDISLAKRLAAGVQIDTTGWEVWLNSVRTGGNNLTSAGKEPIEDGESYDSTCSRRAKHSINQPTRYDGGGYHD